MTRTLAPTAVIEDAVLLACRAPSYHNSQPWTWVVGRNGLQLFGEPDRLVATDTDGRQALLSCGAALDHLRVAAAAAGWAAVVERFPNPADPRHIATIDFVGVTDTSTVQQRRADAILRRRTDRLPFAGIADWEDVYELLRDAVDGAPLDVIGEQDRARLVEAAQLADALRLYDSPYHAELHWWTAPFGVSDGIPHSALVSAAESDRVDVGRSFPVTVHPERRLEVTEDRASLLVLSSSGDTREDILRCGEALSALLLEATALGLATCTLTHLTEVATTRDMVGDITGRPAPQVVVRVGIAPTFDELPPPTPRRPLGDVLRWEV
jgi:nitroreductase